MHLRWVDGLLKKNININIIYSSPALRAKTTASFIAKEIDYKIESIIFKQEIYDARLSTLINVVMEIDEDCQCAMMVGHNPGFTLLCNYLSDANIDNMPNMQHGVPGVFY